MTAPIKHRSREVVVQALASHLKKEAAEVDASIERPPERSLGSFAFPCFSLAKEMRKAPNVISAEIAKALEGTLDHDLIQSVKSAGPYVNFSMNAKTVFAEGLSELIAGDEDLGLPKPGQGKTVVVEFSSPNIAKPFQISHIRSTNIGNSISRIYEALGYHVIRINHIGDWGTSFGKMIAAYKKWGSADFVREHPVDNLYKLYVRFHQEEDAQLLEEAKEWSQKLEQQDGEALELWEWFRDLSLQEFKRIYMRLHVHFDHITGESFYNNLMEDTLQRLKKKKLTKKSESATIIDLSQFDMPPCLVLKSDGTTLYVTRDLAAAEYRAGTFKPDKMLYVVGSEQILHFRQLFKVLELMGYPWATSCRHLPFGLIKFGEEKMSSRKGNVILMEDVLNKAVELVRELIISKNEGKPLADRVPDEDIDPIAEEVGIGAVVFGDLKTKRTKDVSFSWSEILNFDGETGPYLQYTHARISSVLARAGAVDFSRPDMTSPEGIPEETALLYDLLDFNDAVLDAAHHNEPSELAKYLILLARSYNRFYYNHRILNSEPEDRYRRLRLSLATQRVLGRGLSLLGVTPLERM